jgi:hypothetical protein
VQILKIFPSCGRVSISSVFPGREKDWVEFGTFLYEDERAIQTFKNEEGILGKYVKVSGGEGTRGWTFSH